MASTAAAVGIDLGTTNSCVSYFENNLMRTLLNDEANRITPSVVAFTTKGKVVGGKAKHMLFGEEAACVYEAKRFIGRRFTEEGVQKDMDRVSFKVVQEGKDYISFELNDGEKVFRQAPEQISADILRYMKGIAETEFSRAVKTAVVTVPARFNDTQRKATIEATKFAGFEECRLVNEPTAAAICYGLDTKSELENILIYDLGGGTFDVSMLSLETGEYTVKGTVGDTQLGGADFDNRLFKYCTNYIESHYFFKVERDSLPYKRLYKAVVNAKHDLSGMEETTIRLMCFFKDMDISIPLRRSKFESLCQDLFEKTMEHVDELLEELKISEHNVNKVILVGGSTRIPKIRSMVEKKFKEKVDSSVDPDESVARGAAALAEKIYGTTDSWDGLLLLECVSFNLGIDVEGELTVPVLKKDRIIPATATSRFYTSSDCQTEIHFKVIEGDGAMTADNTCLKEFTLQGITPAPKGEMPIKVTFEMDCNRTLRVTAEEEGKEKTKICVVINLNKG